jgi:hypothetical protein
LLFLLGACTEQATAPGVCPDFCPGATIGVVDTILRDVIERDSAYFGYVTASEGPGLPVANLPGAVDSRAIFRTIPLALRFTPKTGDTTTVPITVDSVRLRVDIVRRDTKTANLWIKIYRLPTDIDSTTTFAQLVPWFADSIIDSVNVSALLALPEITDTATVRIWGDTIQTDGAGHVLRVPRDSSLILLFHLDTAQARFARPDSAVVAYGVRVAADSLASVVLGSNESGGDRGPQTVWFYTYPDTNATPAHARAPKGALFDSFVFDPPTPALDSNLAVGGVPSARSLLRVKIPPLLRDSADVVRATLILVPAGPVPGARGDSFAVYARPVLTDIGAKSPLTTSTDLFGLSTVHMNTADTVRIEMTNLIRAWARADTSAVTTFVLQQRPEAASYAQIRFYSTRAPAFRPALHVTYIRRYAFGAP